MYFRSRRHRPEAHLHHVSGLRSASLSPQARSRSVFAGCLLWSVLFLLGGVSSIQAEPARELRVCADPNNLPFSNQRQEGFENKLAELIARELDATVRYVWWAQRRGFIRNTLRAKHCDVIMGIPRNFDPVLSTQPYYRSTYVFLYRQDKGFAIHSLDDPLLRQIKIGVHVIGDDYANPPPAHALAHRKIVNNVVGYRIYGNYAEENPPARIIDAVVSGEVDVAIVWGPFAGYFAKRQPVALKIVPIPPSPDLSFLPFVFDISLGVRPEDTSLKAELDEVLHRKQTEVRRILQTYGVPLVEEGLDAGE